MRNKSQPELYNIADDPHEKADLAETQAAKARQLEKLLRKHRCLQPSVRARFGLQERGCDVAPK